MTKVVGKVYLIGAGPGDAKLITEKGKECLQKADVILYDRLVNPRLLEYASSDCEFVYCGKLPKRHIMRQEQINQALVQHALEGKTVVRLKGGDPSVFGRVGEEAAELAEHGISYEMIPGVTSSIAAAAYAGIPVTHREYSNTFTIATGHSKGELELDFTALAKSKTCAFYMGIQNLPFICEQLIANGRGESTPVAVIEWGTTGRQKTATGTLRTIAQAVQESEIANPAMTVVGEAVQLREQLAWFERKPYYGKRVLIAKSSAQQSGIAEYLAENGAEVWEIPHFKKETLPFSKEELEAAFQAERLVFTANESAALFMEAIVQAGYDVRDFPRQIQGVSEKSRAELKRFGVQAQEAISSSCCTIYIGRVLSDTERESLFEAYGSGKMLYTHEIKQDERFHETTERLWTEFSWDTVLFPNQAAVSAFMGEMGRLGVSGEDILTLRYAYLGERTGKAARTYGFMNIDEQLQEMLSSREWKNRTIS